LKVDNRDSLENVESKWIGEINEYCPGVKIVLCALKCDLREEDDEPKPNEDNPSPEPRREIMHYKQGLEVAKRIGALRYLGMRSMEQYRSSQGHTNDGQNALQCGTEG